MVDYLVSPQCADPYGEPLYLTAQPSTSTVVVASLLPNTDPSQLWEPVEYLTEGMYLGMVLLNRQANMVISAPMDDAAVLLIEAGAVGGSRSIWGFNDASYGAIQLQQNTDMNLNVRGNGPYPSGTAVLAWSWGGGEPNEVWTFRQAG